MLRGGRARFWGLVRGGDPHQPRVPCLSGGEEYPVLSVVHRYLQGPECCSPESYGSWGGCWVGFGSLGHGRAQPLHPGELLPHSRQRPLSLAGPGIVLVAQVYSIRLGKSRGWSLLPDWLEGGTSASLSSGLWDTCQGRAARQGRAAWEARAPVCGTPRPARGWSLDSELRAPLLLAETHSLDFPSDLLYSTGWPSGPLFACPYNGRVVSFGEDEGIIRTVKFQG